MLLLLRLRRCPDVPGISARAPLQPACGEPSSFPNLFLFDALPSSPFREELLAENVSRRLSAMLSAIRVWCNCLCYRSISRGSVHVWFQFRIHRSVSHAGRVGRHRKRGQRTEYWVIRRLLLSFIIHHVHCQIPIGDRASFRNGSCIWMVNGLPHDQSVYSCSCVSKSKTHF